MNDTLRVDWQTFYEAAKQCHQLAWELRTADKPVHDAVKGECAGMAGDAPGCKQWGEKYDQVALDTMQTCTHLADALGAAAWIGDIDLACRVASLEGCHRAQALPAGVP